MTRIAFLSDTHNTHWAIDFPKVDLLVHAGDFTNFGTAKELEDFNDWISHLKQQKLIKEAFVVYGNHELMAKNKKTEADAILRSVDYKLVHGCAKPFGINMWGCSYIPDCKPWAFSLEEYQLYYIYNQIPVNFDIVVCHTPPKNTLDRFLGEARGSTSLAEVLKTKTPKIFACGHIHSGRGVVYKEKTLYINCSGVDSCYLPLTPIILDI